MPSSACSPDPLEPCLVDDRQAAEPLLGEAPQQVARLGGAERGDGLEADKRPAGAGMGSCTCRSERFEPSTIITAFLVLQGVLDLAVADGAIKASPAKSKVVRPPIHRSSEIQVWADQAISRLIGAHHGTLRAVPELAASCGMREGEIYGIALEDFDFDDRIVKVRRQIKNLRSRTRCDR